ncbi:RNA 3'-terminal phosphate cyclase-like protein [Orussus abietinus]|uniref:RNA 3'-terminal phosphate cyclase-like protein n=1 Tax=Orussus abietinus TaxID=222816 RepID=UPI0006269D20|nr:RNA 3'-terminal phosphate cyclase-like protein [Orussus abietinus]XP_012270515.1 RNA 3'-terminal phosphate cyclase-like protein [Orussus abietinus]
MPAQMKHNTLIYEGCNHLRYRLLLSTLSGKSVKITDIRSDNDDPGLREFEISFVRLLDKLTNGSRIHINATGTDLHYIPGLLVGDSVEHECSTQRGISYYLEAVMALAPFCKKPVEITLKGVTNNTLDPSIDRVKASGIPILKRFLLGDDDIQLTIKKRGAPPLGGGEIHFKCPVNKALKSVQFLDNGMVSRIRGTACSIRVSPAIANRMVDSAKGIVLNFIPDIYIHTDQSRGAASGKSPGFGITLTAESTTGVFLSGEACSLLMTTGSLPCVPEDIGKEAAMKLLDEIYRGGCVDSVFQSMTALFMALGKKDVCKICVGPLSQTMIQFLRDLKDFFGITFKIENVKEDDDSIVAIQDQVILTCVGIGYTNLSRRTL